MNTRVRRWAIRGVVVACFIALSPFAALECVYQCGLRAAGGVPESPAPRPLSRVELALWSVEGGGSMEIRPRWTWRLPELLPGRYRERAAADRIAWQASQIFIAERVRGAATTPRRLARAVLEMSMFVWLTRHFTAEQALVWVSEHVDYGRDAHSAEQAARAYFGLAPSQLSWAEAALLAGLLQRPSGLDPGCRPDRAQSRRQYVLRRLWEDDVLDAAGWDVADLEQLNTLPQGCAKREVPPGL